MTRVQAVRRDPYQIGVLDRMDSILVAIATAPATPSELSAALCLELNTVYRIVRSLESKGYLRRMPDRRYAIGYKALKLRQGLLDSLEMLTISPAILRGLTTLTQETAFLSIRDNEAALCVDIAASPQPLRLTLGLGLQRGLTAGAASKVLLSHAPKQLIDAVLAHELPKITESTVTDPVQLRQELVVIRERGYAVSDSEYTVGAGSVAAPVVDSYGFVSAAVAIGGPADRVLGERRASNIAAVVNAAVDLSRQLSIEGEQ